jgi:type I restriction enzyme R subunit
MAMPLGHSHPEAEWRTRKRRIDPKLDAAGWRFLRATTEPRRSEEEPTSNGPADYGLWLGGHLVGLVEAKKLSLGPQNVLTQAERYAKGLAHGPYNFRGLRAPFLYSTNGEVIWFHDVRQELSRSRRVAAFHSPSALHELLGRDFEAECRALLALPREHPLLRPYQHAANAAIEQAIAERKRHMLVAMATGTGKTYTLVSEIYRLLRSGAARRVLFLVDRRALAAQAVRAFASFEAEPGRKFDSIYEVYSGRFQQGDFDEDDRFDPKALPQVYLTAPRSGAAFVYVSTIQRMAINLLGRNAIFGIGGEEIDDDADRLDIPIHAFDVVIADECHRGYTAAEQAVWRQTLDHFDAIKIGLTATPAAHTTSYFQHLAYRYSYADAVRDGHLVDYDAVTIRSQIRLHGVFLREGDQIERVDPESGLSELDLLEDERHFETTDIEEKVTAPNSNRKILEEIRKYALAHEQEYGRFPKTLIFAANDLPHTSHADQLVDLARDIFGRGDAFVQKITGRVDRPLQRIREFRNRPNPAIVVTVDLLSTGVDIPDLEYIVFLRPVKSRILFEQMLGRGTRKGERFQDKSHFTVFDCFDGTLLEYFRQATSITAEAPDKSARTIQEIIEDIWNNRDREYNIRCLVKRLHRIDKQMAAEARAPFAAFIPNGDVARYARELPAALRRDFVGSMATLRDPAFQDLLVHYPRPQRVFIVAPEVEDRVESQWLIRGTAGEQHRPEEYLAAFERFVRENRTKIEAIRILLDRPSGWGTTALAELRQRLMQGQPIFTLENLQRAHQIRDHQALADIISIVKHAARSDEPLLTAAQRVERAFARLTSDRTFTPEQQTWVDRIRAHMVENLSIDREDFDLVPIFSREGGWAAAHRVFGRNLEPLLHEINEAIAA